MVDFFFPSLIVMMITLSIAQHSRKPLRWIITGGACFAFCVGVLSTSASGISAAQLRQMLATVSQH